MGEKLGRVGKDGRGGGREAVILCHGLHVNCCLFIFIFSLILTSVILSCDAGISGGNRFVGGK